MDSRFKYDILFYVLWIIDLNMIFSLKYDGDKWASGDRHVKLYVETACT